MGAVRTVITDRTKAEKRVFHCEFKTVNTDKRRIKGFASTRFKDRSADIVAPKAYEKAMGIYMQNPVILLQHDMEKPIGTMINHQIVEDGLFVEVEIGKDFKDADETWSKINQGILKAFSVGFIALDWDYDHEKECFVINELELLEVSVVAIPANRESLFSVSKSMRDGTDMVDSQKQDRSKLSILEIKKHLTFLKNVYATLPTSEKIALDEIHVELENMFNFDERAKLLKEVEASSKEFLIKASLRDRPSDSGKNNLGTNT